MLHYTEDIAKCSISNYHPSLPLYLPADSISKTGIKVFTKFSQHLNDNSCEDDKSK